MPNKKIIDLEKELERLRLEPAGPELVSVLNKLAYASLRSDPHKAKACALEAQDLAGKLGLSVEQAESYRTLGMNNIDEGNFAEAMMYCRKSMGIYEKLGNKEGMASVHSTMATTYKSQGLIDKALEHHHESLSRKQECDASKDELAISYLNIGACYGSLQRMEQAQLFYEKAQRIWEESGNRQKLGYLYHNIGCLAGRKKELQKALDYLQKSLDIREDLGDIKGIASTLSNLGSMHEELGKRESALSFFTRSLKLDEDMGYRRGIAHTCSNIGAIYTAQGRLDEAEEFIMRGLSIARKLRLEDWEIHCLENISKLYEAKGDLQKALMYSRELKISLEEHLNAKSMEKIAYLQVQFETEQKEKEAEIYRLKNIELSTMNDELRDALAHVKRLQGMLPICASCKKVRDDDGYWQRIESYISDHSDAKITHGICPECMIKLYGEDIFPE